MIGKSAMEVSIMEEKGLSQYFAITMSPHQACSSLKAWPWISQIVLLIGKELLIILRYGGIEDYVGVGELLVHSIQGLYKLLIKCQYPQFLLCYLLPGISKL
jgi:hypothetical protein